MLYNVFFQLARYPKSDTSIAGASTPCVIHVSWTHPTQHPKLHLDRFSRFAQLPSESPSTLQCALKHDKCTIKKLIAALNTIRTISCLTALVVGYGGEFHARPLSVISS